ncbi:MAG: hypothetical protein CSA35_09425 [Dethiosulfovibrio peptidovorans]|nr:MAG: hypothetical protein CSA35_09425 [Dethiosulfovibrio peptidovorans]
MCRNEKKRHTKSIILTLLLISFSALLLGGCGGGSDGNPNGPGPAPGPDPASKPKTAMEAWEGTWSGTGSASALVDQGEGEGTSTTSITVNSLVIKKGTRAGDAMTFTLNGNGELNNQGTMAGTVTMKDVEFYMIGAEQASGDISVSAIEVGKKGSVTINIPGKNPMTLNLQEMNEPLKDDFTRPLIFTSKGLSYEAESNKDGTSGSGQIEVILSGNTMDITGTGSGESSEDVSQGSLKNGNMKITLTRK